MGRLFGFVAELFECAVAVAPVLEYLDIKVEEAFLAGEFLDVFAGFHTDFFDGETFVAAESNSVSFEYQPIASLYAEEISGEYKVQKATKKVKNNEIYGDFYESGPSNYRKADPQSALAYAIEKAKAMGGNGIINLNIRRTGSGYCVTGMVIKR